MKREAKVGRLDIKATINNSKIVNIEIQLTDKQNMIQRSRFYRSRLTADQLANGDLYEEMKPVILINILDYNLLAVPEYYTKTVTVAEKHRDYEVIEDETFYFIELPKFRKSKPKLANLLECWLAIIDGENRGLIQMAGEKEEIIKEANKEVEEILSDEEMKAIEEFRQTAIWDERDRIAYAEKKARKKGEEEGRKKGEEEGRKKGEREGRKIGEREGRKIGEREGRKIGEKEGREIGQEIGKEIGMKMGKQIGEREKTIEIAQKMLQEKMNIEQISTITGLSKEDIQALSEKQRK